MTDLSERQKQLLTAIVELYVKTGEPISSDAIEKYHTLGVSPATIRNEMVRLT
ncbi:MAG: Heat-inducible transcription repressor HrcA, partial [Candidatus Daviesbacteria bacterium GW2011_GWA2_42_7]